MKRAHLLTADAARQKEIATILMRRTGDPFTEAFATRGLGVKRAMVLGQILPGIPVWEFGSETRFP